MMEMGLEAVKGALTGYIRATSAISICSAKRKLSPLDALKFMSHGWIVA
jgi:hypothetical protein